MEPHLVQTDRALYDFVAAQKARHLRKSASLAKAVFDRKLRSRTTARKFSSESGSIVPQDLEGRPMTALSTRLTQALGLRLPVVSAPMAFAGGGALAATVSRAGGLGLIGGGYGDPSWLEEQFAAAGGERVGVGFITWSLRKSPSLLTDVLRHRPVAVMLSFGDPRPFVEEIRAAKALIICQCQDMGHVMDALDVNADVVVAQGAEAGGHGALRGTLDDAAIHLRRHAGAIGA